MVETIMSFTLSKPISLHPSPLSPLNINKTNNNNANLLLKQCSISNLGNGLSHQVKKRDRGYFGKVNALPDWPLMAVLVEHIEGQRDLITHKSIWHLSDDAIKNVYTFYIMFTCWGCCFFGATKVKSVGIQMTVKAPSNVKAYYPVQEEDPYYDSEQYRGDGGDGTGHWVYEKQEDIEESARAALLREELIEEIEQKVGGLRELEEASRKEELVK